MLVHMVNKNENQIHEDYIIKSVRLFSIQKKHCLQKNVRVEITDRQTGVKSSDRKEREK